MARRMAEELRLASHVQRSLLPPPLHHARSTSPASSCPFREIGGDYYDFLPLGRRRLALAIGDVMGKGVPAALLAANLKACLRAQVQAARRRPGAVDRAREPPLLGRDAAGPVREPVLRRLRLRARRLRVRQRRPRPPVPRPRRTAKPWTSAREGPSSASSRTRATSAGGSRFAPRRPLRLLQRRAHRPGQRPGGDVRRRAAPGSRPPHRAATRPASCSTLCWGKFRAGRTVLCPRTTRRSSWPRLADAPVEGPTSHGTLKI